MGGHGNPSDTTTNTLHQAAVVVGFPYCMDVKAGYSRFSTLKVFACILITLAYLLSHYYGIHLYEIRYIFFVSKSKCNFDQFLYEIYTKYFRVQAHINIPRIVLESISLCLKLVFLSVRLSKARRTRFVQG